MDIEKINKEYTSFRVPGLEDRYLPYSKSATILRAYEEHVYKKGFSEDNRDLVCYKFGHGSINVLFWSQMHGNETTGTKALLDLFNTMFTNVTPLEDILERITIYAVPVLNPDGAEVFTRVNAKGVDLNRDATDYQSLELQFLKAVLDEVKPSYCFNLHDQRNIFNPINHMLPATLSFLSPSQSKEREVTEVRLKSMEVIVMMNKFLQTVIPNQVGRYTDEFYPTATGDNFQMLGYPTILVEAGHYIDDLNREHTRRYNFLAIIVAIDYIAKGHAQSFNPEEYFNIPENDTLFFDVIERANTEGNTLSEDIAYLYDFEIQEDRSIPYLREAGRGDLSNKLGFNEL